MARSNRTLWLIAGITAAVLLLAAIVALAVVAIRLGATRGTTATAPTMPPTPTQSPGEATPAAAESPSPSMLSPIPPRPGATAAGDAAPLPEQPTALPTGLPTATPTPTLTMTPLPPGVVLAHSGDGPGATPTVELPEGVYRVFFQTDAPFDALEPVVEEGPCDENPFFDETSGPFEGSATYRSIGCRVHFQVSGIDGSWTLTVETADGSGLLTPPASFSGDGPATTDLIDLPVGDYLLVFTTDSPYSMVVAIVTDGLCREWPVFLLTEPGRFETPYNSTGCRVVFQVGSVTAGWELSILPEE
jgi:hypothetical protein